MKVETLKQLIDSIPTNTHEVVEALEQVKKYIDLYEKDGPEFIINSPYYIPYSADTDMIPYNEICSCNPKNGGSGVCGCVMGNRLVPRNPPAQ